MDSIDLLGELTILSILKLILTCQDYRLAYIYDANLTNEFSSKILELVWNQMVPVSLVDLEKKEIFFRRHIEEQTLNVFVINELSDIPDIEDNKFLSPNDVTVILFITPIAYLDEAKFHSWMKISIKVMILSKTFLLAVNQFSAIEIEKISIHPYDDIATQRFVQSYLAESKGARGSTMTIFMQHIPPHSSVGPVFGTDNYSFNGPDGVITDALCKALNVNPTFVSDVAIVYPFFWNWKKSPQKLSHLHYYLYHKEATTSNIISKFNAT